MPSALTILGYLLQAMPYVAAALLGILVPALAVLCYSRFGAGIAVIFGMYAIEALYMDVGGLQFGIALYYTDFVLLFMGVVGALRLLFARDLPRRHWAWMLFGLVFLASLATGLATYGSTAGVQARPYFYFLVAGVYGIAFGIDAGRLRLVLNLLVAMALLLLGITAYRWIVYYTPITDLLPPGGSYNADGPIRVIRSYEALILTEVLTLGIFLPHAARGLMLARLLAPLLLGVVIALQHRSAWIAGIVGALASLLIGRSRKASASAQLLLVVSITTVTALPLVLSDGLAGVTDQVAASAGSALAGRGTTGERLESWTEIVARWAAAGPRSIVIGQSFGTDPGRYVHDEHGVERKIAYTAHNFYVQTLFNFGLVGLLAFAAAAAYVVRGLYRIFASGKGEVEAAAMLVLMVMQLGYYVPYGTDYLQSLIFGVALAYVATRERAAVEWSDTLPAHAPGARSGWA